MSWPHWIEVLKEHYLDDAASAFLVVGDIHAEQWRVEGENLDAANVLVRFLAPTRPVVGVLRNGVGPGLRFPTFADEKKFDELVDAAILMSGQALALSPREPLEAMGRIWMALTTTGTDQAYMVVDVDKMVPGKRRRIDPIPGAPELFAWPAHPTLRQSNNLIVFLAPSVHSVREELAAACHVIDLAAVPVPSEAELAALSHLHDDVPDPTDDVPKPDAQVAPAPVRAAEAVDGEVTWESVLPSLERAVVRGLLAHPEEHRPAKLPIMAAVAETMTAFGGPNWSSLALTLDEEGGVVATGDGADAFLALWRSDIALDAASGMLLNELKGGFSEAHPPDLSETALRALSKRIVKKLRA